MYYEISIDGYSVGVFGHTNVQHMNLSVGVGEEGRYVFASAVCRENGGLVHYDWLQKDISDRQRVEIAPTEKAEVAEPRHKFRMGSPRQSTSRNRMCDFCQRAETEVARLIYIDEHRPSICSECVDLCSQILSDAKA